MGVFGIENRELAGSQPERRRIGWRGEEGVVLFAVVGLRLGEAGERRPEQCLAAGLDKLDVDVVPMRLELRCGERLRRVGLHKREAIVARDVVAAGRQVGRQAAEEGKCGFEAR